MFKQWPLSQQYGSLCHDWSSAGAWTLIPSSKGGGSRSVLLYWDSQVHHMFPPPFVHEKMIYIISWGSHCFTTQLIWFIGLVIFTKQILHLWEQKDLNKVFVFLRRSEQGEATCCIPFLSELDSDFLVSVASSWDEDPAGRSWMRVVPCWVPLSSLHWSFVPFIPF